MIQLQWHSQGGIWVHAPTPRHSWKFFWSTIGLWTVHELWRSTAMFSRIFSMCLQLLGALPQDPHRSSAPGPGPWTYPLFCPALANSWLRPWTTVLQIYVNEIINTKPRTINNIKGSFRTMCLGNFCPLTNNLKIQQNYQVQSPVLHMLHINGVNKFYDDGKQTSRRPIAMDRAVPVQRSGRLPCATGHGSCCSSPSRSVNIMSHLCTGCRNLRSSHIFTMCQLFTVCHLIQSKYTSIVGMVELCDYVRA